MAKAPAPICTACGGTGVEYKPFGPFFTSVQKRWRKTVQDHTEARHEVFRVLDREIARQVIPCEKAIEKKDLSIAAILVESDEAHEKATHAHLEGDITKMVKALLKVATSVVYVLETLEIELNRNREDPSSP